MITVPSLIVHTFLFILLYFEVFLLISFFERRPAKSRAAGWAAGGSPYLPSVTIVVPCFNEEHTLSRTVHSLLALDYPRGKLEIVVVNDGSTDGTARVADGFAHERQVRVLHKENGGKYTALNLALRGVESEVVGCLDADSYADRNALKELVRGFQNPEVKAVTPAIKVSSPHGLLARMQKEEYTIGIFFRYVYALLRSQYVTPGPLSLYRRELLEEMGEFCEAHNTEDMEMALRIQSRGYHIDNVSSAYVYTNVPQTVRSLVRQRVRWMYGFLRNMVDYRHLILRPRHGNLGMLVLPSILMSAASAVFFLFYAAVRVASAAADKFEQVQAVGVAGSFNLPALDPFFISIDAMLLLSLTLGLLTVVLILIGRYLGGDSMRVTRDLAYYLVLYGLLAPFWVTKAAFDALRSKQGSWVKERM